MTDRPYDVSPETTSPVIVNYGGTVVDDSPRSAFYGITEIAAALALDRQLVTAWRRRGTHAMPEPDAELSSGPIWRGESIEPWIDAMMSRRGSGPVADLSVGDAERLARRVLRSAALVVESPVRTSLLARALVELAEAVDLAGRAQGPRAELAARVVDALGGEIARPFSRRRADDVRRALVGALPATAELLQAGETSTS